MADSITDYDFLYQGTDAIKDLPDYVTKYMQNIGMVPKSTFKIKNNFRLRKENHFYVVRLLGSWILLVENNVAEFLINCYSQNKTFNSESFPGTIDQLAQLYEKKIIEIYD